MSTAFRYADPRSYPDYKRRVAAALERRDIKRIYCLFCRFETFHSHGTRYAYCLTCMHNQPTPTGR